MPVADEDLLDAAARVRGRAHAPYSRFLVGAAVRDEAGRVHVGCNVENASFPEGTCAETGAIAAMVAAGGRRIEAIAIVGGPGANPERCLPCGGCRQRIAELGTPATRVITRDRSGRAHEALLKDLLPEAFAGPP